MKRFAGLSLGAALAVLMIVPGSGQAASFGGVAASADSGAVPLVQAQARPRGRVPRSTGRVHRGRGGGAAAGALLGAAIIGGAIIANSQRNRGYYYDDGYYDEPAPVYTPRRRYYSPYYGQPGYIVDTPEAHIPQQYVPAPYYGGGGIVTQPGYPRHRYRNMRDPAGGGLLK